jgi:hypothetical protein
MFEEKIEEETPPKFPNWAFERDHSFLAMAKENADALYSKLEVAEKEENTKLLELTKKQLQKTQVRINNLEKLVTAENVFTEYLETLQQLGENNSLPSYNDINRIITPFYEFTMGKHGKVYTDYTDTLLLAKISFHHSYMTAYHLEDLNEILTKEFINEFGKYLAERIKSIKKEKGQIVRIVEIGAGDGILSYFLRKKLAELSPEDFELIATDKSPQGYNKEFTVEEMDYQTALDELNPDIIISSWMSLNQNWTPAFRQADFVQEYILIGDYSATGGLASYHESSEGEEAVTDDGFTMEPLKKAQQFLMPGSLDSLRPGGNNPSGIESFKRVKI